MSRPGEQEWGKDAWFLLSSLTLSLSLEPIFFSVSKHSSSSVQKLHIHSGKRFIPAFCLKIFSFGLQIQVKYLMLPNSTFPCKLHFIYSHQCLQRNNSLFKFLEMSVSTQRKLEYYKKSFLQFYTSVQQGLQINLIFPLFGIYDKELEV